LIITVAFSVFTLLAGCQEGQFSGP